MDIVQCWDDGVTSDARLADLLRCHGAKATFNLNAGKHQRSRAWKANYRGSDVRYLGWDEMRSVYEGFVVANHSLTHPHLETLAPDALRAEVFEGRERLQQFFGQAVAGFAYPFGTYSAGVMQTVRDAGHSYARTVATSDSPFPPDDPMACHPSCHFLAPDFWRRYEAARAGGVFYFWGHSYELLDEAMWADFERVIARIGADSEARWRDVADLFAGNDAEQGAT